MQLLNCEDSGVWLALGGGSNGLQIQIGLILARLIAANPGGPAW
jgi:hypothetical protein